MDPRAIYEQNLELIETICACVCRRNGCYGADAEDFTSTVHLRLIDDDYAKLRRFQGRSSLKTFLTAVVANLFRDFRNHKWGKWRPAAEARRRGEVAIRLDALLHREGYGLEEAIEHLRRNHRVETPAAELAELAARLPERPPRRFVDDADLRRVAVDGGVEAAVEESEKASLARRARATLKKALAGLEAQDQVLLRLFYEEGLSAARISELLQVAQRQVYSRRDRCLRGLRQAFEEEGLRAEEVLGLIGWDAPHQDEDQDEDDGEAR